MSRNRLVVVKRKKASGFTIVELLIVIVVIAILAAISIVAYNGIQDRAKLAQQTAQLDKIGKAIQLWSAGTGKTLGESGTGYDGRGVGYFTSAGGAYGTVSVENLLRDSGYLTGEFDADVFTASNVMLAPCTDYGSARWVVMATVTPAPPLSATEQRNETGCANSLIGSYTSGSYNRNLLKAY